MKREPILFLLTLLVLGLMVMGLNNVNTSKTGRRAGGPMALDVEQIGSLNPVAVLSGLGNRKDVFRKPSTDEELPSLVLPSPPLQDLPVLMPPPYPDPGAQQWGPALLTFPGKLAGGVNDLVDLGASEPESNGNVELLDLRAQDPEEEYGQLYDSVKLGPLSTLWGWILDEDRFEKENGALLTFQEVDPESGKKRFAPREFQPGEYEQFELANTLRNEVEIKKFKLAKLGTAREIQIHEGVLWLLDQGLREPLAFQYAEERAHHLVAANPSAPSPWLLLGEVWERTFKLDKAFQLYAALANKSIAGLSPIAGLSQVGGLPHPSIPVVRMAGILRLLGADAAAGRLLHEAVAMADGDASADLAYGQLLLDQNQIVAATKHFETALNIQQDRTHPQAMEAAVGLGVSQMASGKFADATRSFANAFSAVGGGDAALEAKCGEIAALYLSGAFDEASLEADDAVQMFGPAPSLLYLRGIAVAATGGSAAEVVRDLRASAQATPLDAAHALAALAFWYDLSGETDLAEEALEKALTLQPSHLYSRYLDARWAARAGNPDARDKFGGLVGEAPDCSAFLMEFAHLLQLEARNRSAEVVFRQAETHRPKNVGASATASAWAELALRRGLNLLAAEEFAAAGDSLAAAQSLSLGFLEAQNAMACLQYAQGDLAAAVAEFGYLLDTLRDQEDHPQAQFAKIWQDRINAHARLRLWEDNFDGNRFLPGWDGQTGARLGVEPRVYEGKLTVAGAHRGKGMTRAVRNLPAQHFRSFSGDLVVGLTHRGNAGLFTALESRNGRQTWVFQVFRDREGYLTWAWKQGVKEDRGRTGTRLDVGVPVRISFELNREPVPPILQVRADGVSIWSGPAAVLRSASGSLVYGVYGETANALPVDFSLDNLKVIYLKP
jgi:tetratricopeptide (TPR) repeat protein